MNMFMYIDCLCSLVMQAAGAGEVLTAGAVVVAEGEASRLAVVTPKVPMVPVHTWFIPS